MARDKASQQNIDGSDLFNYPNKRIRNNDGSGNGTPVNESVYGDIHEYFAKTMREAGIPYNGLPDNTTNKYQLYDAFFALPQKNDFIEQITLEQPDTIQSPIRVGILKINETLIFRANFDSIAGISFFKGIDNLSKNVSILGGWKSGDLVRLINNQNNVSLLGLYDSNNVANLPQTLTEITNTFNKWTKIMSVFVKDGAMVFWNKPANEIPLGWKEVVEWRGRMPVGLDITQSEFAVMGKMDGSKNKSILRKNLPKERLNYTNTRQGTPDNGGGGFDGGGNHMTDTAAQTDFLGDGIAMDVLNPYRVVLFIEYVG